VVITQPDVDLLLSQLYVCLHIPPLTIHLQYLQLQCIGGSGSDKQYIPEVVQCTRVGFDGQDAQWRCEADLSTDVKFGEVDVSCEGYAYPEDQYILKGSCGLKYALNVFTYF
jgi:hypothetical protein